MDFKSYVALSQLILRMSLLFYQVFPETRSIRGSSQHSKSLRSFRNTVYYICATEGDSTWEIFSPGLTIRIFSIDDAYGFLLLVLMERIDRITSLRIHIDEGSMAMAFGSDL
jgi:hypothetical protein